MSAIISGQKFGFEYFAAFPYYPKRYNVSEEFDTYRIIVWNFKDGRNSEAVAEALAPCLTFPNPKEWWLCIIPASTEHKTQIRFERFCSEYCRRTGLNNGFHLITNTEDREAKHTNENRNSVNLMGSLAFDSNIRGKRILLFDDVYTTGKSFFAVASKLKAMGALEVHGFFLGKTTWPEESI